MVVCFNITRIWIVGCMDCLIFGFMRVFNVQFWHNYNVVLLSMILCEMLLDEFDMLGCRDFHLIVFMCVFYVGIWVEYLRELRGTRCFIDWLYAYVNCSLHVKFAFVSALTCCVTALIVMMVTVLVGRVDGFIWVNKLCVGMVIDGLVKPAKNSSLTIGCGGTSGYFVFILPVFEFGLLFRLLGLICSDLCILGLHSGFDGLDDCLSGACVLYICAHTGILYWDCTAVLKVVVACLSYLTLVYYANYDAWFCVVRVIVMFGYWSERVAVLLMLFCLECGLQCDIVADEFAIKIASIVGWALSSVYLAWFGLYLELEFLLCYGVCECVQCVDLFLRVIVLYYELLSTLVTTFNCCDCDTVFRHIWWHLIVHLLLCGRVGNSQSGDYGFGHEFDYGMLDLIGVSVLVIDIGVIFVLFYFDYLYYDQAIVLGGRVDFLVTCCTALQTGMGCDFYFERPFTVWFVTFDGDVTFLVWICGFMYARVVCFNWCFTLGTCVGAGCVNYFLYFIWAC
eukprot:gene3464-2415_t